MSDAPRVGTVARRWIPLIVTVSLPSAALAGASLARQASDATAAWETEPGVGLAVDAEGFEMPTALAFVPEPGAAPDDPLYFVAELAGTIKVVTNDRSVHVFARGFFERAELGELPTIMAGQTGLGAVCLDGATGYVFVTFAYQDSTGTLRNGIVRFASEPGRFSLRPSGRTELLDAFASAETGVSHQVGGCRVHDGHLYVGVGDGLQPARSRDTTSVLGKVLRLTLDGAPVPTNRFYRPLEGLTRLERTASYIWSSGLRNPFGLVFVDGALFVADNGIRIDRFLQVRAGEDYLWDGTDMSIGARADLIVSPAIGPVQLDRVPEDRSGEAFEGLRGDFFVATSSEERPGVLRIPYSVSEGRMRGRPRFLVRYRGDGPQVVAALAVGPDGVYFAPILPDEQGRSPVLRAFSTPEAHGAASEAPDPRALIEQYGCLGCHRLAESGGNVGPNLDADSINARLTGWLGSEDHRRLVEAADRLEREPFTTWRQRRRDILELTGYEQRLSWIEAKIQEPRFENPASEMPRLEVPPADAERIALYLVGPDTPPPSTSSIAVERSVDWVRSLFPPGMSFRRLGMALGAGFAAGALTVWGLGWILRRRRRTSAGS